MASLSRTLGLGDPLGRQLERVVRAIHPPGQLTRHLVAQRLEALIVGEIDPLPVIRLPLYSSAMERRA
jgi:hypothetical protein